LANSKLLQNQVARRVILFAITAIVAQIAFWFLSMPGPQLRQPNDLWQAVICCGMALITLGVFPWVVLRTVSASVTEGAALSLSNLGLGAGDRTFGMKAIFWCAPTMLIGTWIGGGDPAIQSFYPIPGDQIGQSAFDMLVWFSAYLVFYVSFEFFYRGVMIRGLGEPNSTRAAWVLILIQATCCFLIHLGKPNAELLASLPASVLFGWIAWRSRSIWYGLAIHYAVGIVNDLAAMPAGA